MATDSTSPPPLSSEGKKRKRSSVQAEEIEVDVSLPEPPSKKAARRAKKGKSATSATFTSMKDVSDLIDDDPNSAPTAPTTDTSTTDPPSTTSTRSPHGIWIGNLSFLTTPSSLRTFLCTTASLTPSQITRVHLPLSSRPLMPHQQRQILTDQRLDPTQDDPVPKFQNKGFAYVDFSSADALFQALQATEQTLQGRNVLIKDANNFSGRPEPVKPDPEAADKAGEGKPRSKKVFVGNLAFDTSREDLEAHFAQAGEVEDAFVATFEDTGKCKGFGYVRFKEEEEAERAVRGWVWKVEDEEAVGEEEEESADGEEKKVVKEGKKRKWWINKLHGRLLRCEYAEDASTRYKKRFGKGKRGEQQAEDGGEEVVDAEGTEQVHGKRRRHRVRGTEEEKAEARQRRPRDARTIAPGKALANAPRQTTAIVQSQGKKITFD
ncbi:RNA recognition motif-containing protein 19 [Elsinoe fawcettii]|nr:RNA recognition motif-containing protein 19 [Elsinoe fawcettii]